MADSPDWPGAGHPGTPPRRRRWRPRPTTPRRPRPARRAVSARYHRRRWPAAREACTRLGKTADGAATARRAWVAAARRSRPGNSSSCSAGLKPSIGPADQRARFDRLAWSDTAAARAPGRAARRGRPCPRRGAAGIAPRRPQAPGTGRGTARGRRHDPALVLEQARWLRRAEATWRRTTLCARKAAAPRPSARRRPEHRAAFWDERNILARHRLRDDDPQGAYALAAEHAQTGAEQVAGRGVPGRLHRAAQAERPRPRGAAFPRAGGDVEGGHYAGAGAFLGWRRPAARRRPAALPNTRPPPPGPTTFYGQLADPRARRGAGRPRAAHRRAA